MRRRALITLLGGAAAIRPMAARAAIGDAGDRVPPPNRRKLSRSRCEVRSRAQRHRLFEGENVTIEYRWADNQIDRLPAMAAELVRRRVAIIVATGGGPSAFAAKAATTAIPIVFNIADDPVSQGLVATLARPGGNITGVSIIFTELTTKRLNLLRELVPGGVRVAVLVNPNGPSADVTVREIEAAAETVVLKIHVLKASTSREIDAAFANFVRERPDALFVGNDAFLTSRRVQLVHLASSTGCRYICVA